MADPKRLRRYAREMRQQPTLAERQLWKLLRDRRLGLKFRRQVPLGDYIADFACFHPRLIVEADSARHRLTEDYDAVRDAWFIGQGFIVLRVSNADAIFDPEAVIARIRRAAGLV